MKELIAKVCRAIPAGKWDCKHLLCVFTLIVCCCVGLSAQTLSLTSKDFGSVAIGFSNSVNVTLTNGASPLTISGLTTTSGFSDTSNCPISPQTLAATAKCTITVSFNPVALGSASGTLAVNDSASNSPQTASLTGTGIAQVVLSPVTLGMGSVPVNTTSAAKTVTLKNAQPIPVTIASIGTSGNFAQTSNCPFSPSTLAASTTCTISVTFTPTVSGTNSGTLTVSDNTSTSPQSIPLTGTGTGSGGSAVSLSPATQNFGSVGVGSSSSANFTLTNGTSLLTITNIATTGNYSPTSTCPISPQTLTANTSCTITVTFNPGTTGTLAGTLTVTDSASNSPQTATLTGTGANGSTASLSPASQNFGSVAVGSSGSATFTLTNGTSPLTISGIGAAGNYSQTSDCPVSPQTLAANGSCTITVSFNPATTGTLTGTLTVSDSASNSPQTATLTGIGGAANSSVTLSPASKAFGSVTVGSSSSSNFTLTNGTSALTIASIGTTGNYSQTSNCPISPQTLAANGSCTITVNFNPATTGTLTGTLTVSDSASNSPQTAALTGTGAAGSSSVTLTPANKGFGQVAIGSSNSANFTLTNTTTPLTISSIGTTGNYSQTSNCPISPQTLPANASCTITVSFGPVSAGALTGTLTVTDSASISPQTSSLTGTGVLAVGLSPGGLAMGSQTVDTTSASKPITLTNNQSAPLTISSISTSGTFGQTSNCPMSPSTLAANATCTISVTFSPTTSGTVSGTLTITDSAPSSPQMASLTGTGVLPVTLSSSTLSFSSQLITTTSSSQSVTLKNAQSNALTISGISTTGNFAQTSTCPISPNTLASGATCKISVTFTPAAVGTLTGTLTVNDNAPTSTQTVGLTGTGSLAGLSAISISPVNPTVPMGSQVQLVATGTFPSKQLINITNFVTWSSFAPEYVPVSANGLAQGVAVGTAAITASSGSFTGQTSVTVGEPAVTSVTVSPGGSSIAVGSYEQFVATLNYSDGSSKQQTTGVTWTSSASNVAAISSSGLADGLSAGTTTIRASVGALSGSTSLNTTQPTCTAPPLGMIGWWTGDGNTVDIAGSNSGTLQNSATYGNGEVGQAFTFAGNGASVLVNAPVYSPAAGTLMFWFLSTGGGYMTGSEISGQNRAPGFWIDSQNNLYWEFGDLSAQPLGQLSPNQWYHVALTYSGSNSAVNVNVYLDGALVATALADANAAWNQQVAFGAYLGAQQPSFVGSMDEVAIFNQALSLQQIEQIYGAYSGGVCKPTLQSIAVNPSAPTVAPGMTQQFSAAGTYSDTTAHDLTSSATWNTDNQAVATINTTGLATAVTSGSTNVSAALGTVSGSTVLTVAPTLVSIQVNPQNPAAAAGTTQPFTATGTFTDGSQYDVTSSVSWSSSSTAVATISASGIATCVGAGQATITAAAGSVTGQTLLTVTPGTLTSITVTPANPNIAATSALQFTATGTFSDGSQQNITSTVTWSSSATNIAGINSTGLATALAAGQTTITATSGSISNTATLTVTSAVLAAIQITPLSPIVPLGATGQLSATGIYTDGSSNDITDMVTWSSSVPTVAIISNGAGTQGLATGLSTGSTIVSATFGALLDSTVMNVDDQVITISVGPSSAVVNQGGTQQFAATATYSSGAQLDLTNAVVWSSSNPLVATVSASGLATSSAAGQAVITATLGSFTSSANVTVSQTLSVSTPTHPRVDISDGTTGQLFVSWDSMQGATYYNLQRSTSANSGFAQVSACSGTSNVGNIQTNSGSMACRDGSLTPGTTYYYRVAACNASGCSNYSSVISNIPITSDCTSTQMPNVSGIKLLPPISVAANVVDPTVTFLPTTDEYAAYAATSIPRRNMLVVELPGSGGTCDIGNVGQLAERLGFDVICVNYSNATEQINICTGDVNCFGNVSQAKLDGTGPCSVSQSSVCGIDPSTKQPYVNSNPADAVTQRISMMLQYLNNKGYNQNGTNWGAYLSGTAPQWSSIIIGGFSQGGDMATFAAYEHLVARAYNLSGPPQATPVNGVMTAASYFTQMTPVTNIRDIYGLVSVNDPLYSSGDYFAVWAALGFTAANNDAEVRLNTSTPIGITCNAGTPSHSFSTSAPVSPGGGHTDTLYLWNEDVYKFFLID